MLVPLFHDLLKALEVDEPRTLAVGVVERLSVPVVVRHWHVPEALEDKGQGRLVLVYVDAPRA